MTAESRCVCCDLPLSMCGKAVEDRQRAEDKARRDRALAVPGTKAALYRGVCVCGEPFAAGTPIRHHHDGWYDALAHPEGPDA